MYFRQILRAQLYGTRTARLARLRPVFRAEVAALKTNRLVLILINIFFSLTAAEHVDNCPASPGGGCRKPAVPHHQEVWLIVPHHISCFCYVLCECWQQLSAQNFYFPLHIRKCPTDPQRPLCTKSDEVRLAEEACKKYGYPAPTIFSKVIDKSIPADIIYEDEKVNNQSQI